MEKAGNQELYLNIFELIDHSTGNPWIDTVNCRAGEQWYQWNEETLQFLTQSFEEAKEMLDKTCLLDDLIEENPKQVLLEMISLWNDGKPLTYEENLSGRQKAEKKMLEYNFYEY